MHHKTRHMNGEDPVNLKDRFACRCLLFQSAVTLIQYREALIRVAGCSPTTGSALKCDETKLHPSTREIE